MSILYLDLDGTLVDVRRRHYRAYADTAQELGLVPLPETEYWEGRRNGASNADLIGDVDPAIHEAFALKFLERVEAPSYVRLDTLIPGARATLAALRESYELVLVTLRQNRESLLEQLDELALSKFFNAVYSRTNGDEPPSKTRLIRLANEMVEGGATVVGDSEADIETARELGIDSICISKGVRSRRYLDDLHPDDLLPDIRQLPRALGDSN